MSLTGALYNAFSGLRANGLAAGLVSTNIANAATESYGRRELGLTPGAQGTHGGVRVTGTIRHEDAILQGDRRRSDARLGAARDAFDFVQRLETQLGTSGTPGSLGARVNAFENTLLTAASNPASTQRLEAVASAARDLATKLNDLSAEVQDARQTADRTIASQVETLNDTMQRLDRINTDIVRAGTTNTDVTSLLDERQRLLDTVSEIVPLRVVTRESGEIAVFAAAGAVLLDGRPMEVGFTPSTAIGPGATLANAALSGLTLNGVGVDSTPNGMFAGGSLAAQFEIRDGTAVAMQARLDAVARDLAERLGPAGPDTTLAGGDPGLFTDQGLAFDAINETGFAGRIALNALVAPGSGGTWRLRDGLGAATQAEVGNAALLQGLSAALEAAVPPGSSTLAPVARSFADQMSDFSSAISGQRVRAEGALTYATTQNTALKELELSEGVDTDQELQKLMQIEQLYTANAKVMSVVDDLFDRLISI
ncbi:flagellar hook-associated protein FlgK [Pseudoponticoccus marisrubri]|uniref:Flagellar hook-associated protein 1 n=1 Tax=Pseudoponticoccus marisrubri TaxID=1685382 RepID=A0A0W7WG97_9RHOB|nr:flagellar hook-associated protein FlgK [Pseudoponticoccus marisrubri]KUF09590.1 flagellar biosynthesis protein FlgK [Pseudoponticoccus marisrubri]